MPDAAPVALPGLTTVTAPAPPDAPANLNPLNLDLGFRGSYDEFEMITPADGLMIRDAEGRLDIALVLAPPLQEGHRVSIEVDGVAASGEVTGSQVELSGLPYGSHASTFGGNALACAAGLAVLQVFDEERLVQRAEELGAFLGERLEAVARTFGCVTEARGVGLLRGLALADEIDPAATLAAVRERGVLLTLAGGNVLRFVPPLVVTREELEQGVDAVEAVLRAPPKKVAA